MNVPSESKESWDNYRLMVEHAGQAIVVAQDGRLKFVNPKAEEVTGYSRQELLSLPFLQIVHPEDRSLLARKYQQRIMGTADDSPYSFRIVDKHGNVKWLEITGVRIEWEGKPATLNFISEITERKKAEQALLESERRFRTLVEQSLIGVCILRGGRLVYANARFAAIFGYEPDEITDSGREANLVHDEDRKRVRDEIAALLRGRRDTSRLEFRGIRKDGETIYVQAHGTRTVLSGQTVVIATLLDVTETQRALEALRESEERFRLMMETTRDALYRLRFDTMKYDYISPAIERLTGYSPEEINDIGFSSLIVDSEIPATGPRSVDQAARQMHNGELDEWRATYQIRDRFGNLRWIADHAFPWRDESGTVIGAVGILEDVTGLRKAEEALRESERRFRELFDEAPVGYHEIDTDGKLVRVNRTELELLGYEEDEILGRPFWEFCVEQEAWREKTLGKLAGKSRLDKGTECLLRTKDGASVPVLVEDRHLLDDEGRICGLRSTVQDIRELKRLQEQLFQAQRLETVGVLAGGVAHDFNNLLTVILGSAQLMLAEMPEGHPLRRDVLEIQRAAERGASLTRQLLAFARKQVLKPQIINVNDVVRGLEPMLRRLIGEDVELELQLAPDLGNVQVDPAQLEQVIMNLAVNARDAMPEGGMLRIETKNVQLDSEYAMLHPPTKPGRYVGLFISDTGLGMDEETKKHIFEPFFTTKEVGKGSGLGLSMVYGIVKQSDGYIWVYSEPGMGTTFKIYFPTVLSEQEKDSNAEHDFQPAGNNKTVLLVEDDERVRDLTERAIARFGFRVLVAENGERALELVREYPGPIDIVVSDVVMPGMSGPELAEKLEELRPDLKILFISGYPSSSIQRNHPGLDGRKVLQKPFNLAALGQALHELAETA